MDELRCKEYIIINICLYYFMKILPAYLLLLLLLGPARNRVASWDKSLGKGEFYYGQHCTTFYSKLHKIRTAALHSGFLYERKNKNNFVLNCSKWPKTTINYWQSIYEFFFVCLLWGFFIFFYVYLAKEDSSRTFLGCNVTSTIRPHDIFYEVGSVVAPSGRIFPSVLFFGLNILNTG